MTISPCNHRPANCCAVKLRWNAAPAQSISERESSPVWLPLDSGKSFCQGQRGAGESTCCTRLKALSQWVQISIGHQCWNICPCGQRQALPLNLPHERLQQRTNRLTNKLLWRPNTVPCQSAMGKCKTIRSLSICPEQSRWLIADRETSRSKARTIMSFRSWYLAVLPGAFLQTKLWTAYYCYYYFF